MPGQIGDLTRDVRGFRIWYTDGSNYKSTSLTLPNLRTEWAAQTQAGKMLAIIRFQDQYETYNRNGILVTRFYREMMRAAPAGATGWRVWYHPPTRSFGAGPAPTMPQNAEWHNYADSSLLAVDNAGNELDDVLQPWDAQLRAAYSFAQGQAGADDQ